MGMKEVIRFDLLAMTGCFILIFFFLLFQALYSNLCICFSGKKK